jgi:hypothetical protein
MSSFNKSTTVRTKKRARARAALGALQAIAPPLAARVATRLFMTPPRNGKAPFDWAALGRATKTTDLQPAQDIFPTTCRTVGIIILSLAEWS